MGHKTEDNVKVITKREEFQPKSSQELPGLIFLTNTLISDQPIQEVKERYKKGFGVELNI